MRYGRWYGPASLLLGVARKQSLASEDLVEALADACRHARVPALHFEDLLRLESLGS